MAEIMLLKEGLPFSIKKEICMCGNGRNWDLNKPMYDLAVLEKRCACNKPLSSIYIMCSGCHRYEPRSFSHPNKCSRSWDTALCYDCTTETVCRHGYNPQEIDPLQGHVLSDRIIREFSPEYFLTVSGKDLRTVVKEYSPQVYWIGLIATDILGRFADIPPNPALIIPKPRTLEDLGLF